MIYLIITVCATLAVSAFCSLMESMLLSVKPSEIEVLKKASNRKGELLDRFVREIERSSSAILAVNTIANTFGATLSGVLFVFYIFPELGDGAGIYSKYVFPALLTLGVLVFSEVLPKNLGLLYRPAMLQHMVYPLYCMRVVMWPISSFMGKMISFVTRGKKREVSSDIEIKLLAERGAKDGLISMQEKDLIANALSLDETPISEIMTPRTVVMALDESATIADVFADREQIPFGRMPVYKDTLDNIVGVVRRRDLLMAKANDQDTRTVKEFVMDVSFVPENGNSLSVLRQLVRKHHQIGIVVDEYGSLTGVVTLEDIFEHLLGSEIFEADDVAVDMRALALKRKNSRRRQ